MNQDAIRCLYQHPCVVGEGPHWEAATETLYWVDMLGQMIHAYHWPTQSHQSWKTPTTVAAVFSTEQPHQLLVVLGDGVAYFDKNTMQFEYIVKPELTPGAQFNDAKQDHAGRIWAVSKCAKHQDPVGGLYVIEGDQCTPLDDHFTIGNGIGFSLDRRYFYTSDSLAHRIYRYRWDADAARVYDREVFVDLRGEPGVPDGLCIDAKGRLWSACWGGGIVRCFSDTGTLLQTLSLPVRYVTSCCFGGPSRGALLITTAAYQLSDDEMKQWPLSGSVFVVNG